jgi:glycosyltransferase involved in cell wall biosynthesis
MISKEIYYWSPFTSKVATINAVINSAFSMQKYSNDSYKISIINAMGEWDKFSKNIENKKIKLLNLNDNKLLNKVDLEGYFKSRFIFIYIFIKSFFSLKKILKINRPNYLIIHLITSLPLFLFFIYKFNTKLILRISGLPKMNLVRKTFWKMALKNVYKVTCPTEATKKDLIKLNICESKKIHVLYDPIIILSEIVKKKKEKIDEKFNQDYFVSIGRLTSQKNFSFLLDCFHKLTKKDDSLKLFIIGSGEEKNLLLKKIKDLNMSKNVEMLGYINNIYPILFKSKCFILSSLWEDPGFVLVEAAALNTQIISSNCKNGPYEILDAGKGGFLYKTNSEDDFINKFNCYFNNSYKTNYEKKIIAKKKVKNFTLFNHYLNLRNILEA